MRFHAVEGKFQNERMMAEEREEMVVQMWLGRAASPRGGRGVAPEGGRRARAARA